MVSKRLRALSETPSWEWPDGTAEDLVEILRDDRADESDLLLAAELAGDFAVVNEEIADTLLRIARGGKSDAVRSQAAISLGPVLEQADTQGFEEPDVVPICERTFHGLQESLRALYADSTVPEEVRRRVLEASVRAPQDWHPDAIRAAYSSGGELWRLTAVFCMGFVRGFESEILEALESGDDELAYQAVIAAGNWGLDAAWSRVAAILTSEEIDKQLLLAAIEAAAAIRPHEALPILVEFTDSDDEEIAMAAGEAIAMAEGDAGEEDDEFDDEDEPL